MLSLTENAAAIIRSLTIDPDLPEDAGLRIAVPGNGSDALRVSASPGAHAGDHVLEVIGARVFLEPSAALLLKDKTLDARVDDEGNVAFLLQDT